MIIPIQIERQFREIEGGLSFVVEKVSPAVRAFCSSRGFVFDERRKTLDSLAEKIETGRFRSWSDVDDLYACTIAVPLPSDEAEALSFLQETFVEVATKRRLSANKAPDVFRFDSTRFIGRLRLPEGEAQQSIVASISFEAQVKTMFEMAWSKTTHALAYKSPRVDWRSLRLAASLKATVEQMDLLLADFAHATNVMEEAPWLEIQRKKALCTFFLQIRDDALLPSEVWPKDVSRFVSNCFDAIRIVERSEQRRRRARDLDLQAEFLDALRAFVVANAGEKFPRSVSLFQIVLGVLLSNYTWPEDTDRWFPITHELESLFPGLKTVGARFTFA